MRDRKHLLVRCVMAVVVAAAVQATGAVPALAAEGAPVVPAEWFEPPMPPDPLGELS